MNNKRYIPIETAKLGIETDVKYTIWDNEKLDDLYHEWVFDSKKDAQKWCDKNNITDQLQQSDKITVYYFGDVNSTIYHSIQTTYKTFQKWRKDDNKKSKDVAFILKGLHKNIQSYELEGYLEENNLKKYA